MGERAKKGSPTSTLHDRHCCGILSWTALEIEPYEVSCLSVISTRHQPEVIRKKVRVSIERNTILCVRYIFYIKISQIRRGNEKVSVSSHHPSITLLYQFCTNWQWKPVNEIKFSLPCKMNALYTLMTQLEWNGRTNICRLRVVPYFPSGIVERAKRERTRKSPNAKKGWRRGEREKWGTTDKAFLSPRCVSSFSRGVIFTRARASLALLSLRENDRLLVVYDFCSSTMTGTCCGDNTWGYSGNSGGSVQHAIWNT